MIDLRVASLAGALAIVACGNNGECSSDRDCTNHLSAEFEDYDEWQIGTYSITVEGYGACTIEIPQETMTPVCRDGNEGISFSGSGGFFIPSNPDSIHVVVERDGARFKDIVVSPDYQRPAPECFPSCFEAHEMIE